MKSSINKFIFFFLVILGFIYFIESNRKPPINWNESYSNVDKAPYGLYVLDQEIDKLFDNRTAITRTTENLYNFFSHKKNDSLSDISVLSIKGYEYIDQYTMEDVLDYVAHGNTVLIFQNYFSGVQGLEVNTINYATQERIDMETLEQLEIPELSVSLTNKNLTTYSFIPKNPSYRVFEMSDELKETAEVLGYSKIKGDKYPNLIRIPEGKGSLILGTEPSMFTNYNMLKSNNHIYIANVLSYVPRGDVFFSVTKVASDDKYESRSILRFILNNPALKWMWYFFLITLVVFVFFTAKRKQRVIPIIKPLANTTVDFTKTVSNLYLQNKDYQDLINKSIIYSLEKIRRKYWIDTTKLDEQFVLSLQAKTGKNKQDINQFVSFVEQFKASPNYASEELLIELNKIIEKIID